MAITTRTLPAFLLLLWLAGVGLLGGAAVYGDFDALVDAARKGEITRELTRLAEGAAVTVRDSAWNAVQSVEEYEQELVRDFEAGLAEDLKEVEQTLDGDIEADIGALEQGEAGEGAAGALVDAAFTPTEEAFTAVLTFDGEAPDHKWFTMADPPLLAVDFPGELEQQVQRRKVFAPGPVDKVIIGRHPEYLRVVFYYAEADGLQGPPPAIERRGDTVTVTVQAAD